MILKALNRLAWRMNSRTPFKPDQEDRLALNTVIEYVNDARETKLAENTGFVKLYIFAFAYFCKHYDATPMDSIPQKELHELLNKPLDLFIKSFTRHLNDKERDDLMVEAGYVDKLSMFATPEQIKERAEKITEMIKIPENKERFLGHAWEEETVKENLLAQATDALIKFKL